MGQSYLVLITKCNKITSQRNSYLGSIKTCPHFQLKCIFTPLPKSFLCSRRIKGESCHSLQLEHCRYNIYPRAAVTTFLRGASLAVYDEKVPSIRTGTTFSAVLEECTSDLRVDATYATCTPKTTCSTCRKLSPDPSVRASDHVASLGDQWIAALPSSAPFPLIDVCVNETRQEQVCFSLAAQRKRMSLWHLRNLLLFFTNFQSRSLLSFSIIPWCLCCIRRLPFSSYSQALEPTKIYKIPLNNKKIII